MRAQNKSILRGAFSRTPLSLSLSRTRLLSPSGTLFVTQRTFSPPLAWFWLVWISCSLSLPRNKRGAVGGRAHAFIPSIWGSFFVFAWNVKQRDCVRLSFNITFRVVFCSLALKLYLPQSMLPPNPPTLNTPPPPPRKWPLFGVEIVSASGIIIIIIVAL